MFTIRPGTAAGMTDADGKAKLVWRECCPAREEAPRASVPDDLWTAIEGVRSYFDKITEELLIVGGA